MQEMKLKENPDFKGILPTEWEMESTMELRCRPKSSIKKDWNNLALKRNIHLCYKTIPNLYTWKVAYLMKKV